MTALPLGAAPKNANARPCDSCMTFVIRGGPGAPTTACTLGDSRLLPRALVATAEHRYAFPVLRFPTERGEAVPLADPPAPVVTGLHVTSYCVIALPLSAGVANATLSEPVELFA